MIRSIEIKGIRGIREEKLDEFAPLTVLVGPNGFGKSTVLDALLIGASPDRKETVAGAVNRRPGNHNPGRWLLWRGEQGVTTKIRVDTTDGETQTSPKTSVLSGSVSLVRRLRP